MQTTSARGGASLYKFRFRNMVSQQKLDRSCKGDDAFDEADVQRRQVQFLYRQGDTYAFMDLDDFSQFELSDSAMEEHRDYLVEGTEDVVALMSDNRVLGLELPPVVDLEITQCDPSMRGASATSRTKPATLSTGLVVQVPEHLSPGEIIRIDTRTARYLGRA